MKNEACVYDIVLNGEVVYVGMTNNPAKRIQAHRTSGVAPDGAEIHVHKWYTTRKRAFREELKRQKELKPIFCSNPPARKDEIAESWRIIEVTTRLVNTSWTDAEVSEYVALMKSCRTPAEIKHFHKRYAEFGKGA